jgi:hypothetical protein
MIFVYVTDTNRQTWTINLMKVVKMIEDGKSTMIYLDDGLIIRTDETLIDLTARFNNV